MLHFTIDGGPAPGGRARMAATSSATAHPPDVKISLCFVADPNRAVEGVENPGVARLVNARRGGPVSVRDPHEEVVRRHRRGVRVNIDQALLDLVLYLYAFISSQPIAI